MDPSRMTARLRRAAGAVFVDSSITRVFCAVGCNLRLVPVAHGEQHLLRVNEIAAFFAVIFEDSRLDDRVDRAALLAETAEDAFGEVDVVAGRPPRTVLAFLGLDRDRERRTYGFAQLAGDAALLAVRIAAQRVQAAKTRALRRLLFRELHRDLAREHVPARKHEAAPELAQEPCVQNFARAAEHRGCHQWNSPAQRVCIITPRKTIHTSVTGMNTFQPRRMIW